jgi:hypothetical protein
MSPAWRVVAHRIVIEGSVNYQQEITRPADQGAKPPRAESGNHAHRGGSKGPLPTVRRAGASGSAPVPSIAQSRFFHRSAHHRFLRRDFISGRANRNDRLNRQGVLLSPKSSNDRARGGIRHRTWCMSARASVGDRRVLPNRSRSSGGVGPGCAYINSTEPPTSAVPPSPAIAVCAMHSERACSEGPSHRPDYNPLWPPPPPWCVHPDPSGRAYRLRRPGMT